MKRAGQGTVNSRKAPEVRAMFSKIAIRYDLLNALLSFGVDTCWRREATEIACEHSPRKVLDVATGTADLALMMKRRMPSAEVVGVDFAEPMLEVGRSKARRYQLDVKLEHGDGLNLPFSAESFDVVTIAYGLRNFADIRLGLREFYRVLKPAGRLVVLEFPRPPRGLFGYALRVYHFRVIPFIGGWISGDRSAYAYLPSSIREFPDPRTLVGMMRAVGFDRVTYKLQSFGISALHVAEKRRA
ncbi:MAG: bifunctional demethylmenaquinone methyltransferase/2-methoxy-6-polyprenyl-1,4-benzoquinol methylase UbiE [Trueperaceae bacterium]|nr:MAG: bifunctional demethylmenaquinone methyltransferase/2-methoxy-6-polyprenyl-1,4-benzoquinol methylase UbiE [Trueperaceae bacterium]